MSLFKRSLGLGLAGILAFSAVACGAEKKEDTAGTDVETETSDVYKIAICRGGDDEFTNALILGFTDAVTDQLGAENVVFTQETTDTISTASASVASAVAKGANLVFTTDKYTLQGAVAATSEVPVVATGVVDFQKTLRIAATGSDSWDKKTGINVTGVTCRPSIVDQTSLLIEATSDLQTVGILFSAEDTDAIYQNEILEKYLDQAGIPWKEYPIPVTKKAMSESESEQGTLAISPSKIVAVSAKEGVNNEVVSLSDESTSLLGLNSQASNRTAKVSALWTGGKIVLTNVVEENEEDSGEDVKLEGSGKDVGSKKRVENKSDKNDKETGDSEEDPEEPALEERIIEACNECSVIYIPFASLLTDQMETIGQAARDNAVITVAGDTTIAQHCLVTLYSDPYAMGYAAGKKAKKILVDESDPATMKITSSDVDPVKLYNEELAEAFGMTFPKSFKGLREFLETYELGSTTERVSLSDNPQ